MYNRILFCLSGLLMLTVACERPSSPNVELQHAIQIPVISNRTIAFIGGSNALIDTTSADFEDLFSIDGDGLVRVMSDVAFNIGDFDDIFPVLDVEPSDIQAEIGFIDVSFTGNGKAVYEEVTGVATTAAPGPGMPIAGGVSSVIDIELDVTDFETGIIASGGIVVTFTNHLGFVIREMDASLISDGTRISGPEQVTDIDPGANKSLVFPFQQDDEVSIPVIIRIQAGWDSQTVADPPGDLLVSAMDDGLLAQNVTAIIRKQDFVSGGIANVADDEFRFEHPAHFVDVEEGILSIEQIVNRIDLDIDSLIISFPGIIMPPWRERDTLVVLLTGPDRILRNEVRTEPHQTEINGARIYAMDNEIVYNLKGITEETRTRPIGDQFRTIDHEDQVVAEILILDMTLTEVYGMVQPRIILLNDDDGDNKQLDLFHPVEAQITELEDLEFLSKRVNNLIFYNPELNLEYESNIGVPSRVYAAIIGVNSDNDEMFLRPGGPDPIYQWVDSDTLGGFLIRGSTIPRDYLIAFDVEPSDDPHGDPILRTVTFNESNSNIAEFISNLPVEVRFIGKSLANRERDQGTILDPVLFETTMNIDIPMNFGTETVGSIQDTMAVDLGNLPDPESNTKVAHASLFMGYENHFPTELDVILTFLDEFDQVITYVPVSSDPADKLLLDPAPVHPETRFTNGSSFGDLEIVLNEDQMLELYRTRNIRLSADMLTTFIDNSPEVKMRFDDYLKFNLNIDVSVNSRLD